MRYLLTFILLISFAYAQYYEGVAGKRRGLPPDPIPDISGLFLYLESETDITKDGGNLVSSWLDQTVNNNDAAQSTASLKPLYVAGRLNGYAGIKFDNANDWMDINDAASLEPANEITIFLVVEVWDVENLDFAFQKGNGLSRSRGYGVYFYPASEVTTHAYIGGAADETTHTGLLYDQAYVWTVTFDKDLGSNQMKSWIDGADIDNETRTSAITYGANNLTLGGAETHSYLSGIYMYTLACYNVLLSDADKDEVESWLGLKYGLTIAYRDGNIKIIDNHKMEYYYAELSGDNINDSK